MKIFIDHILPGIKQFSQKLSNEFILKNQNWVLFNENKKTSTKYIFHEKGKLLISNMGEVKSARWEYVKSNMILIELDDQSILFNTEYIDDNILVFQRDGTKIYSIFVNERFIDESKDSAQEIQDYYSKMLLYSPIWKNDKSKSNNWKIPYYIIFSLVGIGILYFLILFLNSIYH